MKISTFTYKGQDLDMTYNKGKMAYTFKKGDNTYGISLDCKKKGTIDIASVAMQLALNAVETIDTLNENK